MNFHLMNVEQRADFFGREGPGAFTQDIIVFYGFFDPMIV